MSNTSQIVAIARRDMPPSATCATCEWEFLAPEGGSFLTKEAVFRHIRDTHHRVTMTERTDTVFGLQMARR